MIPAGLGLILLSLFVIASCNFGVPDFTLYVTLEEGVEGNPVQGEHLYEDLSTVSYKYESVQPGANVEVYLNETRRSGIGSFVMYNSANLTARIIDIRGTWNMKMTWLSSAQVNFDYEITFYGPDTLGGTFTDNRGLHGTWTGLNDALYITYTDWNDFEFSGSVYSMKGSFFGDGNPGSWTATRVD